MSARWLVPALSLLVALVGLSVTASGEIAPTIAHEPGFAARARPVLSREVERALAADAAQEMVSVIVRLRDQADLTRIPAEPRAARLQIGRASCRERV